MLSRKKYLVVLFITIIGVSCLYLSCQKETKLIYEDRLTGVSWKLYDCKTADTSIYKSLDTCIKDNYETYRIDGTYTEYEGTRKCVATDPIEQRGTWTFSTDRKILYLINYKAKKSSFDVIKLDKDFLNVSYIDTASRKIVLFFKPKY